MSFIVNKFLRNKFREKISIFAKIIARIVIFLLLFYLGASAPSLWERFNYSLSHNEEADSLLASQVIAQPVEQNHLFIPKIGLDAPITWRVSQQDIESNLDKGVVHLKDTTLPNEISTNTLLIGYSSYYWWVGNSYYKIFNLLDQLDQGDLIKINYQGSDYIYKVESIFTANSSSLSKLLENESASKNYLYLMSWAPTGTYFNNLIVKADLIIDPSY